MHIRFNVNKDDVSQEHLVYKKIEFIQVKRQIELLATFLPDEILQLDHSEVNHRYEFVGILLFGDVSGFTQLTEKYNKTGKGGIYRLTATLNAYIGAIVEIIFFYGGDVQKFSGDAFLALWKVKPDDCLFEMIHNVVICALLIQKTLGKFETEVNVELKVKLAISCGNVAFSVVGDKMAKQYMIAGEPILDLKHAENLSVSGDVVISPGAWAHMLKERYEVTFGEGGNVKVWEVFYKPDEYKKKLYFAEKESEAIKLVQMHINHRNELHAKKRFDTSLSDSKITEKFVRSLPQRVHMKLAPRNWIVEELRPFIIKPVQNQIDECQPVEYLTEMREITVQFINIVPTTYFEPILLELVDKSYKIVYKIAGQALGVVNKVSLFDKDFMILVLFGLRTINHDMESQNALRSAYKIYSAIRKFKEVKTISIGVTHGFVYCGVVGHPMRREYSVIGGAVNKAARIMCSYTDKVTCDQMTYRYCKLSSFYFQLQTVLKLKGIEDAGNIFEYNEKFDSATEAETTNLPIIGRHKEINLIKDTIFHPVKVDSYGICFEGTSKVGKSKILEYALSLLKEDTFFSASVSLDGNTFVAYSCISKLYRQLYDKRTMIDSVDSYDIINLPRTIVDLEEMTQNATEDIAIQKYRVLNYFRDITQFSNSKIALIFIDNVEHIDLQSWEILELTLLDKCIRLFMTGNFEKKNENLRFKLSVHEIIKIFKVKPLHDNQVATVACQFLAVAGIPTSLVNLLVNSCEGRPGYVQCCLLRLVNNGSIELELVTKPFEDENYIFPPGEYTGHINRDILPIIKFSDKKDEKLTLATISLDLFDSFTPYQQLVIKTGSVLGDMFTRTLLIVALNYPTELALAQVIKQLFDEQVLECGAHYLYTSEIERKKESCGCYFKSDFYTEENRFPKYAYCKVLHFKNKSIKEVAYDLLPGNQKKELHLLCTNVLENMNTQCPNCLKNPFSIYIHFGKFNEILEYCNNPSIPFRSNSEMEKAEDIKVCIRKYIRANSESFAGKVKNRDVLRTIKDLKLCNCYEILIRNFKDLIYHSTKAGHLGKQIFFTMQLGLLLVIMRDYINAMSLLTEARELCLIDANLQYAHITENFKRLHVGKIELGLAKSCLDLQQIKQARNHLSIALRQYHIPLVALHYKHFNKLIARSYLVNAKSWYTRNSKNSLLRADLGICFGYCAKLFALEGNWKLAKYTSSYSIYLLKSVSVNIGILFDIYSNAIDLYKYSTDNHTCYKLQKQIMKQLHMNYALDLTYNLYSLIPLLENILEYRAIQGDIQATIRMGYRVLEIVLNIPAYVPIARTLTMTCLMLLYNFRIKDCFDLMKLTKRFNAFIENESLFQYYKICLLVYITSGFLVETIEEITAFARHHFSNKRKYSWDQQAFLMLMHIYYSRYGNYQSAEEWKINCSFNSSNIKSFSVLLCLTLTIESKILTFIRNLRFSSNTPSEDKLLKNLFSLLEEQLILYKIYTPQYLSLKAWYYMVKERRKKAFKILEKGLEIARNQENILLECFIVKLKLAWSNGYSPHTRKSDLNIKVANNLTAREWAQSMTAFPLYY